MYFKIQSLLTARRIHLPSRTSIAKLAAIRIVFRFHFNCKNKEKYFTIEKKTSLRLYIIYANFVVRCVLPVHFFYLRFEAKMFGPQWIENRVFEEISVF